ncbi:MAG: AAA family ATPase, partial [Candidatus Eremiobacterota bacterium]
MGWVYRVSRPDGPGELALKLLRPSVGATRLDSLRFQREFDLASTLSHPALVAVFDHGVFQEQPYYTMELVTGVNIRSYLGRDRERPTREAWLERVGTTVGRLIEGLAYIHQHGVVHRDLKPENVLVDAEGLPRVLDFGLARRREASVQYTEPGMVVGTVHYMAPEQISGAELDFRTDLYSLGVIIYELLANRLPFDNPEMVAVLYAILHEPPRRLRELVPWLPAGLEHLVMRLLEKQPADRYQSASEVLQAWREVMGARPALTADTVEMPAPPSAPEQLFTPRFVGREAELARLVECFEQLDRQGSVVLVQGVSGVGKTRFLQEASAYARSLGLSTLWAHGNEVEGLPYNPWIRLLQRSAARGLPPDLEPFREALSAVLPELKVDAQPSSTSPDDPMLKFHLFEGMVRLLAGLTRDAGLVLVLEDMHWADPASLEFLHYLARSILSGEDALPRLKIALVATYRDELWQAGESFQRVRSSLSRLEGLQRITLEALTQTEASAMVRSMLGHGDVENETLERLFAETEGNPLFIGEILKTFVAEGRIRLDRGSWHLDSSALP